MVFHVRWIFSYYESLNFIEWLATRVGFVANGEKSISHGKPCNMNFLAYFALQRTIVMLNTLRKVEDHENQVGWIYLTTVLYMGESQKYARSIPRIINMAQTNVPINFLSRFGCYYSLFIPYHKSIF